jgi:hypothetical protein
MDNIRKRVLMDSLKEAMSKEDLNTRAAARCLNLNPCYLSMAQNPNSWDAMGKAPWERIELWADTRDKLSSFVIPEGEEIWKPKEKGDPQYKSKKKQPDTITTPVDDSNMFNALKKEKEKKAFREGKKEVDEIVKKHMPDQQFIDTARLKVALDIEINLTVNGQNVQLQ